MRIPLLLITAVLAAPASADALLDQALANGGAYDPAAWAYVSTTKVWSGGGTIVGEAIDKARTGKREAPGLVTTRVTRYDPSKPPNERLVVITDSSRDDEGEVIVKSEDDDELPSYADLKGIVQGAPKKIAETAGTVTYRFAVDPKKVRKLGSADIGIDTEGPLPQLTGTAVVRKTGRFAPYVQTVTVVLPVGEKGRGNAVGRVRQLSMGLRYAPDPANGVKLIRAFGFDTSVKALGLVTVDVSVLNKADGYRFVGK